MVEIAGSSLPKVVLRQLLPDRRDRLSLPHGLSPQPCLPHSVQHDSIVDARAIFVVSYLPVSPAPCSFRCPLFAGLPPASTSYKGKLGAKLQTFFWGKGLKRRQNGTAPTTGPPALFAPTPPQRDVPQFTY